MGSVDIPPFLREKMKQKVQAKQKPEIPPFMQSETDIEPSKKKVGTIGFEESSLQAGNSISQSGGVGGEEIPKPEKNDIDVALEYGKLRGATKWGAMPSSGKAGEVFGEIPDEEKRNSANKLAQDFKEIDLEGLSKEFSDFPQAAFERENTSKETLIKLRKENPIQYAARLNNAKTVYKIAENSDVATANRFNQLADINYASLDSFISGKQQQQDIINQTLTGVDKEKATARLKENASRFINSLNPDLVDEYENSDIKGVVDANQYAGLKTWQVFEPEKYKQAIAMLKEPIVPQYQYEVNVTPEEKQKSITTDSALAAQYGGKLLQSTINQQIGKETVLRQLNSQGLQNAAKDIQYRQYVLAQRNKVAKDDAEKFEIAQEYIQTENELAALTKAQKDEDAKYPYTAQLKFDQQVKDITGDRGASVGELMYNKYAHGIGSTVDAGEDLVTTLFGSESDKAKLRNKRIGEQKVFEGSIYLPPNEQRINPEEIIVASDNLKKKVNGILKGRSLGSLSEQERKQVNDLVAANQDEIETVTNPEAGKSKNFFSKATALSVAGFTSDIAAFMTNMGMLKGVGLGGKLAEATTLFKDGYTEAFNRKINEGASVNAANEYGLLHGGILALMAKFGSKYDAVQNILKGGKSPLAKKIAGISEETWNNIYNENKGIISRLASSGKNIAKEQAKMVGVFGVAAPTLSSLADNAFYDQHKSVSQMASEASTSAEEILVGSLGFIAAGLAKGAMKPKATPLEKIAVWELGDNPTLGKAKIDEAVKLNELTSEEGERRKGTIDKISKLIEKVPQKNDKSVPLTDNQKTNYLYNLLLKENAKEGAKSLPEKQAEVKEKEGLVADFNNQILLSNSTENQLTSRKKELQKQLSEKDDKGKLVISDQDKLKAEAEIEAIDTHLDTTKKEVKEEELPNLSQPIPELDVNEKGIPIGENVPPEVKGQPEQITQPIELSVEQSNEAPTQKTEQSGNNSADVKNELPKGKFVEVKDFNDNGYELPSGLKDRGVVEVKSLGDNRFDLKLQDGKVLKDVLIHKSIKTQDIDNKTILGDSDKIQVSFGGKVKEVEKDFKQAAQQVRDNLQTGEVGYVKMPNGEVYEISTQNKTAKLLPAEQSGKDVVVDEGVGGKNLDNLTKNTNLQQNEQAKAISEAENKGTGIGTPTFSEKSTKEKPLNLSEKVRQIEDVTDPYDRALQHFATDGKINSSAINELFGGKDARIRFKSSTENEKRARISLIGKDAPTIDKLAHELWESDNTGRYTTQDYKDAIERVILDYNSKAAMQKDLVERYDYDAAYEKYINQAYGKEAMEVVNKMTDDEINHILKLEAEKASEEEISQYIDNLQAIKEPSKPEPLTNKIEEDAIQEQSTNEMDVRKQANNGEGVGKGNIQPEIPTQKGEVKGEEVKVGKFESKAREIADKIKATELPSWLKIDDPNVKKKGIGEEEVKKALADATIKMGQLLDKGVEFGQAVKEAVKDLVDMLGEGMRSSIESGFGEEYKSKFGGDFEQRRFTKQMLRSDELSAESKAEIAKTLNYVRQSNAMSLKEAAEAVERVGLDEAQNLVMNDASMKGAVRVTLGQTIIKKYDELSQKATDQETRDYYLDKAIQTANFVTERLGTEPGQTIQAFSMWARLSPEGQLRAANQDMARQGQEKLRRREKDINKIAKEFQKANEETAEEITKSGKVKPKGKTASEKISDIEKKRQAIRNKYKADKGKNLYSGVGLTKEGIEYVGEMAATYIEEGVVKLEIVVDRIIKELKDLTGKTPDDSVRKNVEFLVRQKFEKEGIKKEGKKGSEEEKISKGLNDIENQINKIIKEHYTVPDATKKSLINKFIEEAGLDKAEAEKLAKEVESEFDRIATRKKRNILYNEKARFDKINNTLKGAKKVEKKTVADDIIKYSNLGAFEGKEFADMMANKFGIGEISPEQAAKLLQLAKKVQEAPEGTPKNNATEDLLAYRANLRGNDLGETAQAVWYANVLSGYKTHEKNLVSTFFNSMGELTAEMVKDPKSIPYLIAGYVKGLSHRGRIEAAHTLKTGYSPIHIKKIETPNALERKKFIGGAANPANWFKYIMRLMVAEDVLSFQGLKEARAYQLARKESAQRGFNTWSKKGWDEVNRVLLHTKERYDEAFETISKEGLLNDKGKPTLEGKRRIYEIMENSRPEQMVNDSYGFAAHGTFNHESEGSLGAITNAVASGLDSVSLGSFKPARLVVPFTRIITNVVNNSLDYTPVGLIRAARGVRGFRSFEKNVITKPAFKELSKDERQRLVAKAAIGITSAVALQAMHQAGVIQITGGGTGDKQKDQQLRDSGWQEYSVKIGGRYYSYKYTPLVFMLGYMGNMNDAQKYGDDDEKTLTKKMEVATSRIAGQVVDMTWINSSATFLGALAEKNPDRQGAAVSKSLAGMTRGFIPFGGAVTQGTQFLNSVFHANKKQADGAWQALVATIPIAQNSLNDKINALGDPIQVNENTSALLPDFVSKEKDEPVWKLLLDNQGWVAPVNKNTLIVFDPKTEQDRPVTSDEYYEFSKKRGAKIKDKLKELLKSGEMVDWNSGETLKLDKVKPKDFNKWLSKVESKATEETKAELFGEAPEKETKDLDINQ